jgi:hypothetical protein
MGGVGENIVKHIQIAMESISQLTENSVLQYGHLTVGSKDGLWTLTKEEADKVAGILSLAGCQFVKTENESYRILRRYAIPGVKDFTIDVEHKPSEKDNLDFLKEKAKAAQTALDKELNKANN